MSIELCLQGQDGLVLATDSRLVSRDTDGGARIHHDDTQKLWTIGNIGIAGIGNDAGYQTYLVDSFQKELKDITLGIDELASQFADFIRTDWLGHLQYIMREFLPMYKDNYLLEFIIAGYTLSKIPKINYVSFSIEQQRMVLKQERRLYRIQGIPSIALYWIRKFVDRLPSLDIETLQRIAVFLIMESRYYSAIGGSIQMVTIQKDIGIQKMSPKKIGEIEQTMPSAEELLTIIHKGNA